MAFKLLILLAWENILTMQTVEITTSHNIVIRCEVASTLQRIIAWFIDLFVLIVYSVIISSLLHVEFFYWIFMFPAWMFYHFFWEVFNNGQSPGKMLIRLRVVNLRGRTPRIIDYFTRWMFRMVDIAFTAGSLATMLISSSKKNQRMGDVLAQTLVIKVRNENSVTLESIRNIKSDQEFLYPSITAFSDKDMMLLKQSLIRYRESPSDQNKDVLLSISQKISEHLDIDLKRKNISEFLDRVLLEYIILTR